MATIKTFVQDIVAQEISKNVDMDLRLIASQNRKVERIEKSRESFELAINMLASNNVGDRKDENGHYIVGRASANANELWTASVTATTDGAISTTGKLTHTIYKSESDRLVRQYGNKQESTPRACIKVRKNAKVLPKATYITDSKVVNTTYDAYRIYKADGKTPIYSTQVNFYSILNYRVYKRAVILDIIPVEDRKELHGFDEVYTQKVTESIDHSRDTEELNTLVSHLVFVYEPFDKYGKPNKYDGFTQLKDWLKSMKCVTSTNPATLGDALNAIVGQTLPIPRATAFTYSGSDFSNIITKDGKHKRLASKTGLSDLATVFTVFGDFDDFERAFANVEHIEYQSITEFFLKDKDENGKVIPDTYEFIPSEVYAKPSTAIGSSIIKHDCHKEFKTSLPLELNHIPFIFGDSDYTPAYDVQLRKISKKSKNVGIRAYAHISAIFD